MKVKRSLESHIRGWFPREPHVVYSSESVNRKAGSAAYVVGYGAGIGVSVGFIFLVDTLGWGAFESSLSSGLSILAGLLVGIPATILGVAVGAKLSKKLKERWVN